MRKLGPQISVGGMAPLPLIPAQPTAPFGAIRQPNSPVHNIAACNTFKVPTFTYTRETPHNKYSRLVPAVSNGRADLSTSVLRNCR